MTKPDIITTAEAAHRLGLPVRTLTRWARVGRIEPAAKLPGLRGAYLFDAAEVERVASERKIA